MATYKTERQITCYNDCDPHGCPGHTATLLYESVSDVLVFDAGNRHGSDHKFALQEPELKAFLGMWHDFRDVLPLGMEADTMLDTIREEARTRATARARRARDAD